MAQTLDRTSALFVSVYPELARAANMHGDPDFGANEHEEKVWRWTMAQLTTRSEGLGGKLSRWFSLATLSRHALKYRWVDLMALLFLERRIGWWKTAA